jgi:methylated-DNA-[protein]-cysteine S-methyltransferase
MSTLSPVSLFSRIPTPLGVLLLVTNPAEQLLAVDWEEYEPRMHRLLQVQRGLPAAQLTPAPASRVVREPLDRYFAGELRALDALAVAACGTPFQRAVWAALREIPPGETVSYAALAQRIGRPSAVRAVGAANGANPIGVVVPCHRVIGADATLTGYAGGLARKRWLLTHERARFADAAPAPRKPAPQLAPASQP